MKRKILCSICIALILSLSLCILATAAHMNRNSPLDMMTQDATTNEPNQEQNNNEMDGNSNSIFEERPQQNDGIGNTVTDSSPSKNDTVISPDDTMENNTNQNGMTTENNSSNSTLLPETNVPDANIGGAVGDNDSDSVPNAVDSDDDNDGIKDTIDSDANGDGANDDKKTTGIVGIVIAVIIVVAIIIVIIAVVPKKPKNS